MKGLLKSVGTGALLGGGIGATALGGLYGMGKMQEGLGKVREADPLDARAGQSTQEQSENANRFRQNLGQYKSDRFSIVQDRGKVNLAQKMAQTRSNLSSRGLLYGGVREGQEAKGQAQYASQMGQERAGINASAEDQARTMEMQAIANAMAMRDLEQQRNEFNYNQGLLASERSKGALGGILGSAGSILGMAGSIGSKG